MAAMTGEEHDALRAVTDAIVGQEVAYDRPDMGGRRPPLKPLVHDSEGLVVVHRGRRYRLTAEDVGPLRPEGRRRDPLPPANDATWRLNNTREEDA